MISYMHHYCFAKVTADFGVDVTSSDDSGNFLHATIIFGAVAEL